MTRYGRNLPVATQLAQLNPSQSRQSGLPRVSKTPEVGRPAPNAVQQVRAEQIRIVYRNALPGVLINVLNASIVTAALWEHLPLSVISTWLIAVVAVALLRGTLV
jgi:hypothetical protein